MLHSASSKQPKLDREFTELTPMEQEVDKFFSDYKNIDRLIKFLSLEEKKGKDKFNGFRFIMFKVCWSEKYYFYYVMVCFYFKVLCTDTLFHVTELKSFATWNYRWFLVNILNGCSLVSFMIINSKVLFLYYVIFRR